MRRTRDLLWKVLLLLFSLRAVSIDAVVICKDKEYGAGNIHPAQFGEKAYVFSRLEWMVSPPITITPKGLEPVELSFTEFAASYPWAMELLKRCSTPLAFTLTVVKLDPPEHTDKCPTGGGGVDAINMYWNLQPSSNLFTSYPVRCNEERTRLMFAVDPAANPVKDAWGDKLLWPTNGRHFVPRGGRDSFESMLQRTKASGADTIPFALAYHSGAEPRLLLLATRSCVDIDLTALSQALLSQYNETVMEIQQRGAAQEPRTNDGRSPETGAPLHDPNDAAANDRWILDRLRKEGVPVDLPRIGKLAPPPVTSPPRPPSPYKEEVIDPDAVIRPGQRLASSEDVASVQAAPDSLSAAMDGRIWPTLQCVRVLGDGTCIAHFGYVLAAETAVRIPVKKDDNWFEPQEFLTDFELPTTFAPGRHSNGFVIRWFCVGETMGSWNAIYWTLKGATATAQRSSPRCDSDSKDEELISEVSAAIEAARSNPGIRKLFGIESDEEDDGRGAAAVKERCVENHHPSRTEGGPRDVPASFSDGSSSDTDAPCDGPSCDGPLQPRLECTHNFENGTCVSYWGYLNTENYTIFRDAGFAANNYFTPGEVDLGQPGAFLPGRHHYVLTTYWPCQVSSGMPQSLTWVMNTTATASSATHNTCPVGCDDVPFSGTVTCPPTSTSTVLALASSSSSSSSASISSSTTGATTPPPTTTPDPTIGGSSSGVSASASFSSTGTTGQVVVPTPCPPPPPCTFGATLTLYGDRNFSTTYKPPKRSASVLALSQPFGVVRVEVPDAWLADFCIDVTEVVECLCNGTAVCHPFDPLWPGATGCNSPGIQKRVLYRKVPAVANDGFSFVTDPPTYCSGERAFTWTQQLVAPPGTKLLVQARWSYSTLRGTDYNCTGSTQGGSGAVFTCCACPSTHAWDTGCGCCRPPLGGGSTNVTVINVIDITTNVNVSLPDAGASAVSAIAAATASVATATATATATSTTTFGGSTSGGNVTVIVNIKNSEAKWWWWLIAGLGICLIPLLGVAAVLACCCCAAVPVAEPVVGCEMVTVEDCPPPPPECPDEIIICRSHEWTQPTELGVSARVDVPLIENNGYKVYLVE